MIRNSLKYVPSKDYKKFTANLKLIYGAPNLKTAQNEFEKLKSNWSKYTGAINVLERNFKHVEQLFDYPSAIRKIMYTTNAIEAINFSYRKVTKKGAFPNKNALFKLLYSRVTELYKKWDDSTIANWLWLEINWMLILYSKKDFVNIQFRSLTYFIYKILTTYTFFLTSKIEIKRDTDLRSHFYDIFIYGLKYFFKVIPCPIFS